MNVKTSIALAATLLLASNAHAGPQTASKPMDHSKMKMDHASMQMPATPEARAKMANTMFDKIDTNKNGSLSRAEFVEHHRTMSMEHGGMHMDHGKNAMKHDGKEHHAMDHAGHAPSAASTTYQKLDSNKDGKLSKAEMAKHPMAAHFAMLDADKNGYLSSKEAAAHGL
ncbi:EF-hand domain-containing protein [Thermomonas carbonis]|uniref:EF-hand domain-containing protein n=1 Tax=Thermomonas carbonis TaxID=1463158 RepID=A0A7G9SRY8_9GAMM|nr:EF-hand domain-containing protein [Thermomonas carbonis]QNN70613.1 EF-hand domain-containing protein [Thermomonas carbonis]GHC01156.1 hypothetical protein GCM10010080_13270 [Thermomonas carbonis]